jgi:hypothetical protein
MLFGYVYMKEEPGAQSTVIEPALRRLTDTIGIPPRKMRVTTPEPKYGKDRKFTWEWFGEAVRSAEAISLWGGPARKDIYRHGTKRSGEELSVRFNLRYFSGSMRFQNPALCYTTVPTSEDVADRRARIDAIETFLLAVSAPSRPLHGGIAAAVDAERAHDEVTMQFHSVLGPDGRPIPERLGFDQTKAEERFSKARRAYWTTILGPDLAAAAGGVEAARATGAVRVETRGECLIVQSTDDVADFLAPDWPARAAKIRRWIWPHTIQNPADAPEHEVRSG